MRDEHPGGLAVRRHEHLQAAFEVGVLEGLRREVEQVVVLGLVEARAHRQGGVVGRLHLIEQGALAADRCPRQRQRRLHRRDRLGEKGRQLRCQVRQLVGVDLDRPRRVGQLVDPVERVEEGPHRRTQGDVVAVRFPVEEAAQGSERVVEVRDVVPQLVGDREEITGLGSRILRDGSLFQGELVLLLRDVDRRLRRVGHLLHVIQLIPLERKVHVAGLSLHARLERNRAVLDRNAQRPSDVLDHRNTLGVHDVSRHRVEDEHVGWVPHVVVGVDHQDVRVHPGLGEVSVGGGEPLVDRGVVGKVVAVVVRGLVSRDGDDADQHHEQAGHEDGCRPAHHDGADLAPKPARRWPFRFVQPDLAPEEQDGGAQCHRDGDHDDHADRDRRAHRGEVRQPREGQAVRRAGDRQAGSDDDGCDGLERRVVGVVSIQSHATVFAVAPEEEDAVVGGRGDGEHRQDAPGERRQPEHVVHGQNRHHAARRQQGEEREEELDQRGADRAVDDQQHASDRDQGDQGDHAEAGVADDVLVASERRRTRHVRFHAGWGLRLLDRLAGRLHALVRQRHALLTREVQHHVGGLAVGALCARRGQRVAPEVLDVLDVLGVLPQLLDDLVVVLDERQGRAAAGPR